MIRPRSTGTIHDGVLNHEKNSIGTVMKKWTEGEVDMTLKVVLSRFRQNEY